ncbi:MAG TPA: ABC transporter substrate-binding protein [Burkholderiaceae bacterium]|nr:ABC transporter substrate-binding protein [Burkholderiaceae bacterium]
MSRRWIFTLLLASTTVLAPATAQTLRFASAFDPQTMDPHALALLYHTRVVTQIYDGLVNRDQNFKLEPALAVSWTAVNPTTWRFKLRPDVRFHDGAPFTADDAVFSIERALGPTSQRRFQMRGITGVRKVDDLTIDVLLEAPDAVLPEKFWLVAMLSKAWAVKHGVEKAQDFNAKQETYAVRHANGTGPCVLERFEADKETVLKANRAWWGRADKRNGNVAEIRYIVIQSDATRLAALASGQVDFVIDVPYQDVARLKRDNRLRLEEGTDIGTQYFTFDQFRDELQYADVKGRNPFKDKRVRRAVYQALDIDLIVQKVLRGNGRATGSLVSPLVDGYVPELEQRLPHDPGAARALLAEAGYPDGFSVTLDCVNIQFREAVCQAAAAMLTQVGIRTQVQSAPSAIFFPKLSQANASFIEYGWTPATDPWAMFHALFRSHDGKGSGTFNAGRYANAKVDRLIDAIRVEPDLKRRRELVADTLRILHEDLPFIPLYRRALPWAMRTHVHVVQWPNDVLEVRWVRMDLNP